MLGEALKSVASQEWPHVEHIVVDGGSTDGTLDLLSGKPALRLIHEPDRGVYDALNKGLACATGDIVGFLNSDDFYEAGAFRAAAEVFAANPDCEAVCGSARLMAGGETVEVYNEERDKRLASPRTTLLGACMINARFFRRQTLEKIGPFSLDYRVVSDRDLLTRALVLGVKSLPLDALVYTYRRHHASLSFSGESLQRHAIWLELLALARVWSQPRAAPPAVRRVARMLEGRCLGRLIQKELEEGQFGGACRLLVEGKRGAITNLGLVALGALDAAGTRIGVHAAFR